MEQLIELEETAVATAARMVGELGGFYPFACIRNADAQIEQIAADVGDDEPDVAEVHEFILAALSAGAAEGRFTAIALVLNELPPEGLDIPEERVIHAFVDSPDTGTWSVYVPYAEDAAGELSVGEILRVRRESYFFAPHGCG